MTITRKHFKLIAESLKDSTPEPRDFDTPEMYEVAAGQWRDCCKHVGGVLRQTNPAFNRDRFLDACGVES